ncbi:hypothetical protein [Anaerotruncus rubiinfantis]|uniref:hypothetical protein n=1 Tax=Anaerotruncus rubiinfantis TaxID=1720200 RepID=UPI0011C9EBC1|nr:hypothetical protein [Anaerotruncus rubiinfantis]
MKKLLALVLAMACALSLGIPTLAKTADYTWNQVNVEDFVDEDGDKIADDDVIRPGQTIYWVFGAYSDYDYLLDSDLVKIDVDKDEGSKNIDGKPKVVGKKLGNLGRCVALEIVIKDTYTADELKTKLDIYITAKKNLEAQNAGSGKFPIYKAGDPTILSEEELKEKIKDYQKALDDAKAAVTPLQTELDRLKGEQAGLDTAATNARAEANKYKAALESSAYTTAKANYEAVPEAYNTADKIDTAKSELDELATLNGTGTGSVQEALDKKTAVEALEGAIAGYTLPTGWTFVETPSAATMYTSWKITSDGTGETTVGADNATAVKTDIETKIEGIAGKQATYATDKDLAGKYDERVSKQQDLTGKNIPDKATLDGYAATLTAWTNGKVTVDGTQIAYADLQNDYNAKDATATTEEGKAADNKTKITEQQEKVNTANEAVKTAQTNLDRAKEGNAVGTGYLLKGDTMKVPMTIWIQNENRVDDDATFVAGEKGVVIKPVKNEENTVTWEDNNDTLAIMKFTADSDVEYYMPRMATKWNNEDYLDYFDDMDAYIRSFVGNPSIPCTSRARLWINNPFVDDDGEETIDPDDIYVYEVVDGELYDITDKVEYTTNDDDDYAFLIKTRTLGTYIFSDGPADIEDEDDDDYDPEAPDKVEVNNNKKPVPPTGF